MLAPVRTVAPTVPLLTIEEVKAHLRVDHADEDLLIASMIDAVTSELDGYSGMLGRALITQTWAVSSPAFAARLDIPMGPLQSATIQYYDSTNALQTLSTSVYAVLTDGLGPYVSLKYNQQWPQTYTRDDAVTITWVAGYGGASAVPAAIRAAALLIIGTRHKQRSSVSVGDTVSEVPFTAAALLAPFRRVGT